MNKKKMKKKEIIQYHHPDYDTDFKFPLFKREHFRITLIERGLRMAKYKKFSKGFLYALYCLYQKYWDKGVDVENFFEQQK